MTTAHSERFAGLTPITEALRKTTPGFIGLNLLLLALTYAITYGVNFFLAPINSPITSWLGLFLMLAVAATSLTLIGTIALDKAEGLSNTPIEALQNLSAALPVTIYLTLNAVLLGVVVIFLFGSQSLVPMALLLLWPMPLAVASLIDRADEPVAAIKDAFATSLQQYALNAPTIVTIIAITAIAALLLIYAPVLLPPYLIYFLPFTTMLMATLYQAVNE